MRRVLVVSYLACEDTVACSHHVDDRVRAMRALGMEPVLLTSIVAPRCPGLVHARECSVLPSGLRFELRHLLRRRLGNSPAARALRGVLLFPLLPLYALERLALRMDSTWSWQPLAVSRGLLLCRRYAIDTIYSTGGPPVAHAVAARIRRRTGAFWVAEIQDPLIHGYCTRHPGELRRLERTEALLCREPDRMVYLTQGARRATEARAGASPRSVVIHPGAPRPRRRPGPPPQDGPLVLAHFGSLGGVRNLSTLLAALELLRRDAPNLEERLDIRLYGNTGEDDQQRIQGSPAGSCCRVMGLVPRDAALAAMEEAHVLLLIQGAHPISAETIPSKLYEYLHRERLVLGLVHENPELTAMLEDLGHVAAPADEPRAVARALGRLLEAWSGNALPRPRPSPWTVERAVEQMFGFSNRGQVLPSPSPAGG